MNLVHDNIIVKYEINLDESYIKIHTINPKKNEKIVLFFSGVLAHFFKTQIKNSVLLDVMETSITKFISTNEELLLLGKNQMWPTRYKDLDDLEQILNHNEAKCYDIYSSYGLNGFVLAKKMDILK